MDMAKGVSRNSGGAVLRTFGHVSHHVDVHLPALLRGDGLAGAPEELVELR